MLQEYRKAPDITRKRLYLQTMESGFGRNKQELLDADNSGNVLYVPLDQLTGGADGTRPLMPPIVTPDSNTGRENNSTGRNTRRESRQ